ncbi:dnaJ homolog subfamily C member 25 homolog [Liolophura sinensis]|uniref:dnaJ homolog subfamily C member 25 homolog n=1 Tax=Liolophura sinensis TaxID=3198878 RepID=UPI0031580960
MASNRCLLVLLCIASQAIVATHGFIEGLYCGTENCYDILGVTRESSRGEISKAYRKLAKKWHPDMHRGKEAKEEAVVMFQKIANAHEILKDDEQRADYNYMLDNPEEYYTHYYYYYRRRMAPKVDVRIVIVVTITIISAVQYWGMWNNYNTAIKYLSREPKYRNQAMEIAKSQGLINTNKKRDRRNKEEIREEEDRIIKEIIAEKMDIRGGYSRPKYTDVLWVQLILSPYTLILYIHWWLRWIWKFTICREEYGEEEKCYLIRKFMKLSQTQWDALEEADKELYLEEELWIKENFTEWKRQQEEEMKAKMAESAKYKMYRRYMKKGGPGQMTFGPD